jgi:hypothetical protein
VIRSPNEAQASRSHGECDLANVIHAPEINMTDGKEQLDHPQCKELREKLQLTLAESIQLEEQKTRERIAAYKKQQEESLAAMKKTAHEELDILETMISEALHKSQVEKAEKPLDAKKHSSPHPTSESSPSGEGSMKKGSSRQRVRFEESDQNTAGTESGKTHEQPSNLGKAIQSQRDITGDSVEEVNDQVIVDGMEDNDSEGKHTILVCSYLEVGN